MRTFKDWYEDNKQYDRFYCLHLDAQDAWEDGYKSAAEFYQRQIKKFFDELSKADIDYIDPL
jgi:hypothetical protein